MVDYFWLKSFTEIIQLFISVLFLVYLQIKFGQAQGPVYWLKAFFYIKLAGDLYGILNYTQWIAEILTPAVLNFYRTTLAGIEIAGLTSFCLFVLSFHRDFNSRKKIFFYFLPSLLLLPINWALLRVWHVPIAIVFDLIKITMILGTSYLLYRHVKEKALQLFTFSILLWSIIWLTEAVLYQQVGVMSESTGMLLFVIAELIFTMGLAYYLIQIIAKPKLLRQEKADEVFPKGILNLIENNLNQAFGTDQVYKNPELDLAGLASIISVSPADLTTYLNRIAKKNFNQYLIDFRIKETEALLQDPASQRMSIEQVMFSAGFSSKSVFNTAFKQRNGCTPSQFRKQHGEP